MELQKKNNEELKIKLDRIIEKSNAQIEVLKKILIQLNRQSELVELKAKTIKKL